MARSRYSARIYHGKKNGDCFTKALRTTRSTLDGSASPKTMPKESPKAQNLSHKRKLRRAGLPAVALAKAGG
jgi:hypothetical protein